MRRVELGVMYGIRAAGDPRASCADAGPSCYLPWMRAAGEPSDGELAVHRPDGSVGWITAASRRSNV